MAELWRGGKRGDGGGRHEERTVEYNVETQATRLEVHVTMATLSGGVTAILETLNGVHPFDWNLCSRFHGVWKNLVVSTLSVCLRESRRIASIDFHATALFFPFFSEFFATSGRANQHLIYKVRIQYHIFLLSKKKVERNENKVEN